LKACDARGGRGIDLGDLNRVDAYRRHHPEEAVISWMDHSGVGCRLTVTLS